MDVYRFLNQQYIAGQWVKGTSSKVFKNTNPYNQELILELQAASKEDVDSAYGAPKMLS